MTTRSDRPTLDAVAAAAGVSRTTASRVLNDQPSVRDEVRERVREVIDRLDYRPDAVARSLRRQRTGLVGLIVPDEPSSTFADAYLGSLVRATTSAASDASLTVALLLVGSDDQQHRTADQLRREGLLDGVVVAATHDVGTERLLDRCAVPVVVVGEPGRHAVPSVDVDNERGGRLAVEHLLATGRRRVAIVAGPTDNAAARARRRGAIGTLAVDGLAPVVDETGPFGVATGRRAVEAVLGAAADAVVAGSDAIAIGVLDGLHDAGRRVPDDVAVVGFDDLPLAARAVPPLTTVAQPVEQVAHEAVARLHRLLDSADDLEPGERTVLDVELIVRDSTPTVRSAAPPVDGPSR